jgi:hypothetical protein
MQSIPDQSVIPMRDQLVASISHYSGLATRYRKGVCDWWNFCKSKFVKYPQP